jgi:predicted metal-dependent hydrolase
MFLIFGTPISVNINIQLTCPPKTDPRRMRESVKKKAENIQKKGDDTHPNKSSPIFVKMKCWKARGWVLRRQLGTWISPPRTITADAKNLGTW